MATFLMDKDRAGEWRWKLVAGNNEVIADSAEGYKRREGCLNGIALVKRDAATAPVYDVSDGTRKAVPGA